MKKVLMYYSFDNKIGGPLTYINTVINSELNQKYNISTCFQNAAPGGLDFKLFRRMIKTIKQEKPDIVHIHGAQSEGFYGAVSAKLAGCKYVLMTVHGFSHDDKGYGKLKYILYKYIVEPLTLRLSDGVYCVCEATSKRDIITKNCKKSNLSYIHNCVPELKVLEDRSTVRNKLNINEDEVVFCCSGRLVRDKGYSIIADAVKILNRNGKNFRFIVIGDGDYRDEFSFQLKEEIESGQVIITGQTDRVADYLSASDVFVFPSLHENLSLSLLEACKMGLPCIASNVGGNPEVVDGECGMIVDDFKPETYAEKMSYFIDNVDEIKKMGIKAKERADKEFTLSKMCEQINEVYSNGVNK